MLLSLISATSVWAQDQTADDGHAGHTMPATEATDDVHAGHLMPAIEAADDTHDEDTMPAVEESAQQNHAEMASMNMEAMDMGSMQGGAAPADARDPHAYSNGQDFGPFPLRLGDRQSFSSVMAENFEVSRIEGETVGLYDIQGWYGRVYDRAVFKGEGEFESGSVQNARSELLWGHAIATYWDTQLGFRYDSGLGPNRSWLAFGVQGLAPYWFELDAAGYLGENGRSAFRLDASYDLLLTQKLILQPSIEAELYGKSDSARGLGSGLTEASAQLRLRYEIRREFAPYVGVERVVKFGETADLSRARTGGGIRETRWVVGFRFWY